MKFLLFYGDTHPNTGYRIVDAEFVSMEHSQNGRRILVFKDIATVEEYGQFSDVGFSNYPGGLKGWLQDNTIKYSEDNYDKIIAYVFEKLGIYHWEWK